jgi:acyl dehydratase
VIGHRPVGGRWFEELTPGLGFEDIRFPLPVIPGDSIRAQTEVVAARASSSRPTQGVVTFEHRAFNQRGELVAQCRRSALMHRRP